MAMEDVGSCRSGGEDQKPSAASRFQHKKAEVYNEVLRRLKEVGHLEAQEMDFDHQLWAHFNRLPPRLHLLSHQILKKHHYFIHFCFSFSQSNCWLSDDWSSLPYYSWISVMIFHIVRRYAMDVSLERAEDVLTHKRLLHLARDPANRPTFDVRLVQVCSSMSNLILLPSFYVYLILHNLVGHAISCTKTCFGLTHWWAVQKVMFVILKLEAVGKILNHLLWMGGPSHRINE